MSDGIVMFEWRKKNLGVWMIFNAKQRVMRSLECFNNFLTRSKTNLTTVRA